MKSLVIVVLIAAAAAMYYYKPWKGSGSSPGSDSDPATFISACEKHAPQDLERPEVFCRCMWDEGVRNANFQANIAGRSAMSKCMGAPGL